MSIYLPENFIIRKTYYKELLTLVDGDRHTLINSRLSDLWFSDNDYTKSVTENKKELEKIKRDKIPWYPKQRKT